MARQERSVSRSRAGRAIGDLVFIVRCISLARAYFDALQHTTSSSFFPSDFPVNIKFALVSLASPRRHSMERGYSGRYQEHQGQGRTQEGQAHCAQESGSEGQAHYAARINEEEIEKDGTRSIEALKKQPDGFRLLAPCAHQNFGATGGVISWKLVAGSCSSGDRHCPVNCSPANRSIN